MGSPLRSPLRDGHLAASDTAAFSTTRANPAALPRLPSPQGSPLRPPTSEEGHPTRPSPAPPRPSPQKDSPGRSPAREEEDRSTVRSPVPRFPSPPEDSAVRSPAREEDRSARPPHVPRLSSLLLQESLAWSPSPAPQGDGGPPLALPPSAGPIESPPSSATSIVNRAARDDFPAVTKVEKGPDAERGSGVVPGILRRRRRGAAVGRAAIGLRLAAVGLSLVSFSVMAADKTKGWAGDSFDRYREYRFCITVNILTFVYSGFQAYAQAQRLVYEKDIISPPQRHYFDFAMDQVLAYLLMAASSAAATRTDDWVSNWGSDPFTTMANGSTAVSFLAFVAVAVSALISAHTLFSRHS